MGGVYRYTISETYCQAPIRTFDGIPVAFLPETFAHALYKGNQKLSFSTSRAERINWISAALQDSGAGLSLRDLDFVAKIHFDRDSFLDAAGEVAGAIEDPAVRERALKVLEGGLTAFQ